MEFQRYQQQVEDTRQGRYLSYSYQPHYVKPYRPKRMAAQFADALEAFGGGVIDKFDRMQVDDANRKAREMFMRTQKAYADFQSNLATNTDYAEHPDLYDQWELDQREVAATLLKGKALDFYTDMLNEQVPQWYSTTKANATVRGMTHAQATLQIAIEDAVKRADLNTVGQLLQEGVKAGYWESDAAKAKGDEYVYKVKQELTERLLADKDENGKVLSYRDRAAWLEEQDENGGYKNAQFLTEDDRQKMAENYRQTQNAQDYQDKILYNEGQDTYIQEGTKTFQNSYLRGEINAEQYIQYVRGLINKGLSPTNGLALMRLVMGGTEKTNPEDMPSVRAAIVGIEETLTNPGSSPDQVAQAVETANQMYVDGEIDESTRNRLMNAYHDGDDSLYSYVSKVVDSYTKGDNPQIKSTGEAENLKADFIEYMMNNRWILPGFQGVVDPMTDPEVRKFLDNWIQDRSGKMISKRIGDSVSDAVNGWLNAGLGNRMKINNFEKLVGEVNSGGFIGFEDMYKDDLNALQERQLAWVKEQKDFAYKDSRLDSGGMLIFHGFKNGVEGEYYMDVVSLDEKATGYIDLLPISEARRRYGELRNPGKDTSRIGQMQKDAGGVTWIHTVDGRWAPLADLIDAGQIEETEDGGVYYVDPRSETRVLLVRFSGAAE